MTTPKTSPTLEWLLRASCALMLIGHGWVCWNGQMPIRALLWDEGMMRGVVESLFSTDWGTWVSSLDIGDRIDAAVRLQAFAFFAFAAVALVPLRHLALRIILVAATTNLAFLAWLKFLDAGMGIGQLVEHSSQVFLPLILALYLGAGRWTATVSLLAKIALAFTFVGHGLFAIGLPADSPWLNHPRPGKFTEMTMLCLGLDTEAAAGRLLLAAGILDMVVVALSFAPARVARFAFGYMAIWGFLTALARPWAYFDATNAANSLNAWVPEALYRTPHFALPICALLALRRRSDENSAPETV